MMLGKAQMHGRGACFGAEQDSGVGFRYFVVGLSVQRHIFGRTGRSQNSVGLHRIEEQPGQFSRWYLLLLPP